MDCPSTSLNLVEANINLMLYEEERVERLKEAIEDMAVSGEDLEESFGPGSMGEHELLDRANILQSNWEDFIVGHTSTVLDPDLFEKAQEIGALMAQFYQFVGARDHDPGP